MKKNIKTMSRDGKLTIAAAILAFLGITIVGTTLVNKANRNAVVTVTESELKTYKAIPQIPSTTRPVKIKNYKLNLNSFNVVYVFDEIGINSYAIARDISEKAKIGPVYLVLNSPGGSVMDGALIISAMESAANPVHTICIGMCASMAAMIFEHGSKRLMVDRSILMFHNASAGVRGELTKMNSRLATLNRFILKLENYVADRAQIPYAVYRQHSDEEWWTDAEDSIANGLADGLVSLNSSGSDLLFETQQFQFKVKKDEQTTRSDRYFDVIWL